MTEGKTLFEMWIEAYPNLRVTKEMQADLVHHACSPETWHLGDFEEGIIENNLSQAFAFADPFNRLLLEKLVGITKRDYGIQHWGWPEYAEDDSLDDALKFSILMSMTEKKEKEEKE